MCGNNPEPIILPLETVHCCPLVEIPHPNGLVLACGENEVLVWMEKTAIGVLEVSSASVDLPLGLC
jgi:hypothetical protein